MDKQLRKMSDFEIQYSGTAEKPRHYSHIEDSELTFSQGVQAPNIVPVNYFLNLIKMLCL
jgi:AraC family transcriptional regulator, melibiose operon regulatory protein